MKLQLLTSGLKTAGSILIFVGLAPALSAQSAGTAPTAQAIELSLEEAVRRAVDHNPDLAIVRLGTDVEDARIAQADSLYRPVFATTFGRSSNATAPLGIIPDSEGIATAEWFGIRRIQPATALGRRHVGRIVGRVAHVEQQPAQRVRAEHPVRAAGRVLAAAVQESPDRCGAQQYMIAKRNRDARSSASVSRSCRPSPL